MKKPQPREMFTAGDDLPLFSLSPMKAPESKPPQYERRQPSLFSTAGECPICYGSGEVITRKNKPPTRCTCQAGQHQTITED